MNALVTAIFAVFTAVSEWMVSAITPLEALFYNAESGLTFLGTTALLSLGIGVIFLLIGVVQKFLTFRG